MELDSTKRKMAKRKPKDPNLVTKTYRFRIKDSSELNRLNSLSISVNQVWNYCNEASHYMIRNQSRFLSAIDLKNLTSGSAKEVGLNSVTVQSVCEEYVLKRIQFKKRKLKWRTSFGSRKSLGWIPFKFNSAQVASDSVTYLGHKYRVWHSRKMEGTLLCGSFSQDARGRWYVNLACELEKLQHIHLKEEVGIDLGLKTRATLSDGSVIENHYEFRALEEKLAQSQRARKKKQAKKLHAKIRNKRQDFLHKKTTEIAKTYAHIFVGNLSGKFIQATNGKSSADASIGMIRNLLKYKAIRHSGYYSEVNENSSTVICSACLERTGPSGLSDLGVRGWTCSLCNTAHERDVNAAINILRFGRESLRVASAA